MKWWTAQMTPTTVLGLVLLRTISPRRSVSPSTSELVPFGSTLMTTLPARHRLEDSRSQDWDANLVKKGLINTWRLRLSQWRSQTSPSYKYINTNVSHT
ncbi:unnamed protein product [Leptidea sinapis]|uniref:Secreted protein n=1 Tax=Leptidea sinapis TaxID=189913 RepID=A0A5E4QYH1_9NEOP|nr:unnamed protein product [Leptidea sinapis]